MRSRALPLIVVVLALPLLAAPAIARRGKEAPTAPGKYKDWGGEIDQLEVVEPFHLADYSKLVVVPFDTQGTPLPEPSDNTFGPVKAVLVDPAGPFTEGLGPALAAKIRIARGETREEKTLLVRAKVLQMDPGSRAARYWAGFGAGAARAELEGEVVESASGKVLLRFRQERRSGVGTMGGDYAELMDRNLRQIGEDVAFILKAF